MGAIFDTSQVEKAAADMLRAAATVDDALGPAMEHWALDAKNAMKAQITGSWRGLAPAISYERGTGKLAYLLGPDKALRGGPLGNLYYFGSRNTGPQGELEAGTIETMPAALEWIGKVAARHLVTP